MSAPSVNLSATSTRWTAEVTQASTTSFLDKLKSVVSTPTRSTNSLIESQQAFKNFFDAEVSKLTDGVPPESMKAFTEKAEQAFKSIIGDSFSKAQDDAVTRGDGSVSKKVTKEAVLSANSKAQTALFELTAFAKRESIKAMGAPSRPEMAQLPDGSVALLRKGPQIENLVLRGGGAKGIGNGPALVEMERFGMLSGLKHLVGTSAGALTAICLSAGMKAQAFQDFCDATPMTSLTGTPKDFSKMYPQVGTGTIGYKAGNALQLADKITAESAQTYLKDNWHKPEFQQKLKDLQTALGTTEGAKLIARLSDLRTQNFSGDRTGQMITFRDLRALHHLAPETFKELTLTGWDNTNKKSLYFTADSHPDMPIAFAGRISMSLPVMFKSIKMDIGDGGGKREFTDGGVGTNMPSEVITRGKEGTALESAREKTLVLTFDEGGKAYTIMHGSQQERDKASSTGFLEKTFSGNSNMPQVNKNDAQKIYDSGPNAFVIFHGDIGTTEVGASLDRQVMAKQISTLQTLDQIANRQAHASMEKFATIQDAFNALSETERQAIRDGGAPDPSIYKGGADSGGYKLDKQLYDLVMGGSSGGTGPSTTLPTDSTPPPTTTTPPTTTPPPTTTGGTTLPTTPVLEPGAQAPDPTIGQQAQQSSNTLFNTAVNLLYNGGTPRTFGNGYDVTPQITILGNPGFDGAQTQVGPSFGPGVTQSVMELPLPLGRDYAVGHELSHLFTEQVVQMAGLQMPTQGTQQGNWQLETLADITALYLLTQSGTDRASLLQDIRDLSPHIFNQQDLATHPGSARRLQNMENFFHQLDSGQTFGQAVNHVLTHLA